jgi:hypothetical protein
VGGFQNPETAVGDIGRIYDQGRDRRLLLFDEVYGFAPALLSDRALWLRISLAMCGGEPKASDICAYRPG